MPEKLRAQFERKTLRSGYLLNLDGKVVDLVFFRLAYRAEVLDGDHRFVCHYRQPSDAGSQLWQICECDCRLATVKYRCVHQAAMLFHVLIHPPAKTTAGGKSIGEGYPTSLWAALALSLCRTYARSPLRLEHEPERILLVDAENRPVFEATRHGQSDDSLEALPEGWENARNGSAFATWASTEIRFEEKHALQVLGHAPSHRAEFGVAGMVCRIAYLRCPLPRVRLDWHEEREMFHIQLSDTLSDFRVDGWLSVEHAYSLRKKYPQIELGIGFDAEDLDWHKGLEIRVEQSSRLRIRPFAQRAAGEVTRKFPPETGEVQDFGDMHSLPGVGFRRLTVGAGSLFQRYTGWKSYRIEAAAVSGFLAKYGSEWIAGPEYDLDPILIQPQAATVQSLRILLFGREDDRFCVDLQYELGDAKLDLQAIHSLLNSGQTCLITSGGWVDTAVPEWSWAGRLKEADWVRAGDGIQAWLDRAQLTRICVMHAPVSIEVISEGDPSLDFLAALVQSNTGTLANAIDESQFPTTGLRAYQVDGLRWLAQLATLGLSGILADDMGLGKTHQVMALCAWLNERSGGSDKVLIVCPTSVLYHWKEKLAKFHPHLDAAVFHGPQRDPAVLDKAVCITSYGIARNDMALFRKHAYAMLVLDEIQYSKNRDSETHQALRDFPARSTIGLTGTPLENSVWEVKNLFDLILPGYFPGDAQFRREIAEPLEAVPVPGGVMRGPASPQADVEFAKQRFLRLTRPFLLRRIKSQVLDDLPEKIEETYHCEMTPDQATLYHASLKQKGGPLLRELLGTSKPSLLHIFQLLNHLKQICNHPMTVIGAETPDKEFGSGKWDLFLFLLEKSLASGHKVVVFSQYLNMLTWIEQHLKKSGIDYASLTGATSDRQAVLKRFASDPQCRVFCSSLKAGGVGIDLTAAETVIHYDRWWNAARENQATDRVHRIGQVKNVQVFKLVTRGTIEERIDAIIRRKAAFMDALIPDTEDGLKLFTREEWIDILRGSSL